MAVANESINFGSEDVTRSGEKPAPDDHVLPAVVICTISVVHEIDATAVATTSVCRTEQTHDRFAVHGTQRAIYPGTCGERGGIQHRTGGADY